MTDKVFPAYEKVVHVAFGCGCVDSFHVEQAATIYQKCPQHGDWMISTTAEWVPLKTWKAA